MQLEINERRVQAQPGLSVGGRGVLHITPPIDEDYWLARVPVSDKQAVVVFPKFGTYGIGFQVEEDWNTNLPYTSDAAKIYAHIEGNKGDENITAENCIKAIEMLQEFVKRSAVKGE